MFRADGTCFCFVKHISMFTLASCGNKQKPTKCLYVGRPLRLRRQIRKRSLTHGDPIIFPLACRPGVPRCEVCSRTTAKHFSDPCVTCPGTTRWMRSPWPAAVEWPAVRSWPPDGSEPGWKTQRKTRMFTANAISYFQIPSLLSFSLTLCHLHQSLQD